MKQFAWGLGFQPENENSKVHALLPYRRPAFNRKNPIGFQQKHSCLRFPFSKTILQNCNYKRRKIHHQLFLENMSGIILRPDPVTQVLRHRAQARRKDSDVGRAPRFHAGTRATDPLPLLVLAVPGSGQPGEPGKCAPDLEVCGHRFIKLHLCPVDKRSPYDETYPAQMHWPPALHGWHPQITRPLRVFGIHRAELSQAASALAWILIVSAS